MGLKRTQEASKRNNRWSGADTEKHFRTVEAVNLGVTFEQQAEMFMTNSQTRKLDPIKPATAKTWEICLKKWLNPHLGKMPVSAVNNLVLKGLVSTMAAAGLSPPDSQELFEAGKADRCFCD